MSQQTFLEQVDCLIRARYTLLYLVTWEEDRARNLLLQLAARRHKQLFEWSITDGLRSVMGSGTESNDGRRLREPLPLLNEILQSGAQAIYVLKDFHKFMEAPEIVRQLRDLSSALRSTKKTVVILSPILVLPPELDKTITILDLPLPTHDELLRLLNDTAAPRTASRPYEVKLTESDRFELARAAQGLTLQEAENAYALAIVRDRKLDSSDIEAILTEKKQVVRKSGILEYYDVSEDLSSVGGMDVLKQWLVKRVKAFSTRARDYGLPQPKGVLLLGVQGCGKSLVAKTVATTWRLPLLRMDMSRIFQGYIGSSEQNMRRAVTMAESLAPVVLWIDEIDKAFSGVEGSGSSDAGTTARVIGAFLTWIQEKTAAVFVVATANSVQHLPPELLRKGRLDEIFFVDLPDPAERREILAIHLRKMRRDAARFDVETLANASAGFSGAELEQALISAMHDSFFEEREVETRDILRSIQETVPLSRTMREPIERMRHWAQDRARPVSTGQSLAAREPGDGSV